MTLYITSISQNIPCNLARLRFFYSIVIACCFSIAPSSTIGGTLRCANSPTPPANISPLFPSSLPTFNRIFRTYENDAKIVFFLLKNFFFGPFFYVTPPYLTPFPWPTIASWYFCAFCFLFCAPRFFLFCFRSCFSFVCFFWTFYQWSCFLQTSISFPSRLSCFFGLLTGTVSCFGS